MLRALLFRERTVCKCHEIRIKRVVLIRSMTNVSSLRQSRCLLLTSMSAILWKIIRHDDVPDDAFLAFAYNFENFTDR